MQKKLATLLVSAFSMVTTPSLAERFYCPTPVILPPTLNLSTGRAGELREVQAYLTNLMRITTVYQAKTRKAQKNELTNCLMGHLITLPESNALQRPATPQDAATLALLKQEVSTVLSITRPHLRHKPEVPFIRSWLTTSPR